MDVTGDWEGTAEVRAEHNPDPAVLQTLRQVKLSVKPSGEFVLIQMGVNREGFVEYRSGITNLRVKTVVGRPVDTMEQGSPLAHDLLSVKKDQDGNLILIDPSDLVGPTIVLHRVDALK